MGRVSQRPPRGPFQGSDGELKVRFESVLGLVMIMVRLICWGMQDNEDPCKYR